MKNERKIGAILSYVIMAATTIIQLLYTPFLIGHLGQSEYGLYSLVSSIIGYLSILDFGFGNAIIVYTTKYRAQKKFDEESKLHGMFFFIYALISVVLLIIGIVIFFNVNSIFGSSMTIGEISKMKIMMLILTFNLVVTFIFNIYSSIIIANEKFVFQKVVALLNTILKPIIMIPLLTLGFKSIALCIVITLLNVGIIASNYIYCKRKLNVKIKFQGFDKKVFKEIFGYSFFIFLAVIVDKVNYSVDPTILGIICGTAQVSIYSTAIQFNTMFINLSSAINGVLLPKITKMIATGINKSELTDEMIKVGRIQFYILFLICTGFAFVGKEFIIWWVGEEYIEAYYITLLLIVPACVPLIQNTGLCIMQSMNKYKFKSISTVIMSVFNIIISIFLTKHFGTIGAAFGTTISLVICNIILINIYYYKVIKIDIIKFWKNILQMLLKFCLPVVLTIIFIYFTKLSGLISVMIYGSFYTILYLIVMYTLVMNKYEKDIINNFFLKIKRVIKRRR